MFSREAVWWIMAGCGAVVLVLLVAAIRAKTPWEEPS